MSVQTRLLAIVGAGWAAFIILHSAANWNLSADKSAVMANWVFFEIATAFAFGATINGYLKSKYGDGIDWKDPDD